MKVFLTGGTGFVGSHVVEQLLEAGHEVRALVRATSKVEHLDSLGVEKVLGTLGEAERFQDALASCDAVVHVAGLLASTDPVAMYRVNVEGTRDLVDQVVEKLPQGTPFIYMSSVAAQGPSEGGGPRSVEQRPQPVSHYGRSKLGGEGAVLAHQERLTVSIVRPPPVYGPRDRDFYQVFQMANRRLTPVLGRGDRMLSMIHAEDVARAVVACVESEGAGGIYPVDDGHSYSWRELVAAIAEAVGKRALTVPVPQAVFAGAAVVSEAFGRVINSAPTFDRDKYIEMIQSSWVCGHDAIRQDLGWEPKWELREGARQTAQWYREQGWL